MTTPLVAIRRRHSRSCRRSGWTILPTIFILLLSPFPSEGKVPQREGSQPSPPNYRLIGATATVVEGTTGLPFMARVDTGATTCSIHCEKMEIADESGDARQNVGKPIRFLVKNKKGQAEWLEAEIADYSIVKTSEKSDGRYKVKLALRWRDVEKQVLVTLNDRKHMRYPVLIGRNFLRNDFLVNVALEDQEMKLGAGNVDRVTAKDEGQLGVKNQAAADMVAVNDTKTAVKEAVAEATAAP